MNYILFDDAAREQLLPLTFTRPVCDLRVGIMTLREKWERVLGARTTTSTEAYLANKFPLETGGQNMWINGSVCPEQHLLNEIRTLKDGQRLVSGEIVLAVCQSGSEKPNLQKTEGVEFPDAVLSIRHPWDIFSKNGEALARDYEEVTKGRKSLPVSGSNTIIGSNDVFLEEGAKAEAVIFNTTNGPIYIGENAEVMEGSIIRGPFCLGEHSTVKLGAKIYGPTTIGPHCKVGGEVSNSVLFGYSNKGHDGFLGNSVLGEWCNLGADTNNSNLKNNYDQVRVWSYKEKRFAKTGLQFCGLIMGDHSKTGINTMLNTGTVVGVSSNVFGGGFPRTFIPSYSWGGAAGFAEYNLDKALATARRVMQRRQKDVDEVESAILKEVFELTKSYRN